MILALFIAAAPLCKVDDARCWMRAAIEQGDRADLAEGKVTLLMQAKEISDRVITEERQRGDRWHDAAEKVAPKPPTVWDSPIFWGLVGVAAGAGLTIGIAYAVNPASR